MTSNRTVLIVAIFLTILATDSKAQFGGFDDEPPMEEIVVIGHREDVHGFGSMLEYLDFRDAANINWLEQLNNVLDAANEADERLCASQVEAWRQQCHTLMDRNAVMCVTAGALVFYNAFRILGIGANSSNPEILGGAGVALSCTEANSRAHAYCDKIADSSEGPRVAQCAGRSE